MNILRRIKYNYEVGIWSCCWFVLIYDKRHIEAQFRGLVVYFHFPRFSWDKNWNKDY